MLNFINTLIDNYFDNVWTPKSKRVLDSKIYNIFRTYGEGLYYVCIKSKNNDIVSKAINFFSGNISHVFPVLYTETPKEWFTDVELSRLQSNWKIYYKDKINEFPKILVLASADKNGMNYPDFSTYQERKFNIRKVSLSIKDQKKIVTWFISAPVFKANYDYTGLAFWWLFKMMDDERAYYCSEVTQDGLELLGNYKIAKKKNASPTQINKYAPERIIFSKMS